MKSDVIMIKILNKTKEEINIFCPNCGSNIEDGAKFCTECGATIESNTAGANEQPVDTQPAEDLQPAADLSQPDSFGQSDSFNQNTGYQQNNYQQANNYQQSVNYQMGGGTNRSIVMCIVLSFVTCGIYGIYWMIKLNDEINAIHGTPEDTSGGMVLLLTIVTCGIYGIFWMYKMGGKIDDIKASLGESPSSISSSILYLLLSLVGLAIVNYCLMQDTINDVSA